ncbi:CitMHS family citrate-Mg2+:H+ or citrate-Ca2+:H+ symporter [Runella defluvii]|uniref:CitMHS family citrate-Mg2+:H+ or citrate-Ca2+:H+ symporter n=1 Tax=Runella defluvii TaxID=370973 RepID=A0A7W6ES14_9BACT|nr:citrate:proton symporter [Runella defluvii]MBB3840148.1 CitMHS family citrate-Mg2+:H+ or citrate-Ca2+:H+ symporter [Runella defluvii]
MLSLLGFATILVFLALIMTKKMSVMTALVITPVVFGLLAGFSPKELGDFALAGIKQVAPTGVLLMFAVLYFATMLDAGLFDPVIAAIIKSVKGDPLKVILGTAILTMIVHLDGDGTATFMIVLSAFLPIYKQLKINRKILASIVALSVGPLHLVPWSGTSARAISTLKSDAVHIFNPNIPAIVAGIVWVLFVAYWFGQKERKRLGIIEFEYNHKDNLNTEQHQLRRPNLLIINAILTISLIIALTKGWLPAPVLFVIASMIALLVNYPKLADQQKVVKSHGTNIFLVSSMIFAAGIFSGILTGAKMIDAMANSLVALIPQQHANWLPTLTALTSLPASILFTPDAYYFGVVPILSQTATQFGIDPLEIGRAALLGQMTVGFPISPLTASTFLLVGLTEVDLGEHQRHTFFWAWGTTIVMMIMALLTGSIHL